MDAVALLLEQHGTLVLFCVGFLEFIGAPIAAVPMLLVAGAMAAMGALPLPAVVGAAVLGGFAADIVWFAGARVGGAGLVNVACGLSSNPKACVHGVAKRIRCAGPVYMISSKLLPGVGNLAAAGSGFAGIPAVRFIVLDVLSLFVWAGVYGGIGWAFSGQVEQALSWVSGAGLAAALGIGGLIVVAGIWRVLKVRLHRPKHASVGGSTAPVSSVEEPPDDECGGARLGRAKPEGVVRRYWPLRA